MLNKYTPLRIHSHYSTSIGLSKPSQITKRLSSIGSDAGLLSDYNCISGAVDYIDVCNKKNILPIIGCELNIVDEYDRSKLNNKSSILLIAKNINGWKSLVKNVSNANLNYWNEEPHITLNDLCVNDLICITGWLGSTLSNCILKNNVIESWLSSSYEHSKTLVNPDWINDSKLHLSKLQELFGHENLYLGVQLIDYCCVPSSRLMAEGVRYLSRNTKIKSVAIPDSYYSEEVDSADQRVLIVNHLKSDLKNIFKKPVRGADSHFGRFFSSTNYFIPSYDEMILFGHSQDELDNTNLISSMCSPYKLSSPPRLPKFKCPDNKNSQEYMDYLCQNGWDRLKLPRNEVYTERYKHECEILNGAGLTDYFLIVEDIIKYAVSNNQLTGAGRGSAAGSLVLYLLGVTHCDPIKYDLLFERFYNAGRNTPGNIAFPDVDMDFERSSRGKIIDYLKNKYGHDKVCQMVTFQRMQGRGALKDVVRAHAALDIKTINKITKGIPQEAEISDQLQAIRETGEEIGIIEWALDNHPKEFEDWAYYDDDGKIQGPLSKIFEQAIRMEGTKRGRSKHPSGIVISQDVIADICPMIYDSGTKELIADMEMTTLEKLGFLKFDILGVSLLDKIKTGINYINFGEL